jgi:hypothetical protein
MKTFIADVIALVRMHLRLRAFSALTADTSIALATSESSYIELRRTFIAE